MARKRRLNVVCGEMKEIHYDSRLAHIGIDLASDKGTPIILFTGWKDGKPRELFRLHLKEAMEIKASIDNTLVAYIQEKAIFEEDESGD